MFEKLQKKWKVGGLQLALIIATFAIAARQRNLLWSLAAIAGLGAISFAIYVYVRM